MRTPQNLAEILRFLSVPHTLQIEKLIRRIYAPSTAFLIDGLNDIAQTGFAVAMERRFHYKLDERLGDRNPGFTYLNASFLEAIGAFSDSVDGVKLYFGFDSGQQRIVPILTKIKVLTYSVQTETNAANIEMRNDSYYVPLSVTNGEWQLIDEKQVTGLRNAYKTIVNSINQEPAIGARPRYRTEGYFIGRDALKNVLSDAITPLVSTLRGCWGIRFGNCVKYAVT